MTNKDLLMKFKDEFPFAKVSDFRPICHELFTDGKQGITIWLEDGSVVEYYPNTKDDNERMTIEEAIKVLEYALECVDEETPKGANEAEAIPMAIEALKAQEWDEVVFDADKFCAIVDKGRIRVFRRGVNKITVERPEPYI